MSIQIPTLPTPYDKADNKLRQSSVYQNLDCLIQAQCRIMSVIQAILEVDAVGSFWVILGCLTSLRPKTGLHETLPQK